jgi:hypothetical protein
MKYIVVVRSVGGALIVVSRHRTQIGAMDSADRLMKRDRTIRTFIYQGIIKGTAPTGGESQ